MTDAANVVSRRLLFTWDFDRPRHERWLHVHRAAMACRFDVLLPEGGAADLDAARAALDEADRLEAALTVFRASSELSGVNRNAAAAPVAVSEDLFALLSRAQQICEDTGGAFDITTTPLSRCWGFLRRAPCVPSPADLEAARQCVGMRHVRFDPVARTVSFRRSGVELGLGSIGKGFAIDRMASLLRARGVRRALLSAGGSSIAVVGAVRPWPIDLVSPRLPGSIARLRLSSGGLGTSGAGEQFVLAGGRRYGHVIHPATGWPVQGVLSASVVAGDAETADALSTAFLIGGVPLAERYCRCHPDTLACLTLGEPPFHTHVFGSHPGAHLEIHHDAHA